MLDYNQINKLNENMKRVSIKGKKYAQVNDRVMAFRSACPNGSIESNVLSLENGMVVVKATIRDEDGRLLATGLAYEKEGSSNINNTSFVENCETSAVGRALGFIGIGVDDSIASAEELVNAVMQQEEIKRKKEASKGIGTTKAKALREFLANNGVDVETVCTLYKVELLSNLTEAQHKNIFDNISKIKEKQDESKTA